MKNWRKRVQGNLHQGNHPINVLRLARARDCKMVKAELLLLACTGAEHLRSQVAAQSDTWQLA